MIGENATRKGERAKKVPKYMQYDDADYGIYPPPKTQEQKERQATAAEMAQVARLFQKFLSTINQKLRDYDQHDRPDPSLSNHQHPAQYHNHKPASSHTNDNAAQKAQGTTQAATKRPKEAEQRGAKNETRKGSTSAGKATVSSSLQMDQDYHGMLSEHVRSAYPNISNVSADMLRGLDIPRQLLQGQNGKSRGKEQRKGSQMQKSGKGLGREQLKPFKRQSYHVAIAYHIHLKRIRTANPSATEIDPTYPARKLRQSQQQQHS